MPGSNRPEVSLSRLSSLVHASQNNRSTDRHALRFGIWQNPIRYAT
ncbi:hypothetical protein [Rhodanobacter sp. C01]|nr:hypothetical protein [Rhodanobacter sp. C01]